MLLLKGYCWRSCGWGKGVVGERRGNMFVVGRRMGGEWVWMWGYYYEEEELVIARYFVSRGMCVGLLGLKGLLRAFGIRVVL